MRRRKCLHFRLLFVPDYRTRGHIADPTVADANLGSLVHNAYRIELRGEWLRKGETLPPSEGVRYS